MSDNDLFEENSNEAGANNGSGDPQDTGSTVSDAATGDIPAVLTDWVGDGKKYSSIEDFRKAFDKSQEFIDQLKEENAQMRGELKSQEQLDALLDRVGASSGGGRDGGERTPGETPPSGSGSSGEASSKSVEDQINEAVQREVTKREREQTARANETEASNKVVELAGGDRSQAKRMIRQAADDLGVTVDYLQEQAQVSPSAFYRMVSHSQEKAGGSEGSTSGKAQNSEAFETKTFRSGDSEIQPYSYWKRMRREMSKAEYYSPRIQNAIMRSRAELGDSFHDV